MCVCVTLSNNENKIYITAYLAPVSKFIEKYSNTRCDEKKKYAYANFSCLFSLTDILFQISEDYFMKYQICLNNKKTQSNFLAGNSLNFMIIRQFV